MGADNVGAFLRILKHLAEKSQVFVTSFNKEVLNIEKLAVMEIVFDGKSNARLVDIDRVAEIIDAFRQNPM